MDSYDTTIEQLVNETPAKADNDLTITLSTGVVLKPRPVSVHLLQSVEQAFPRPEPPMVYIEEKNRYEYNYSDPDFQKAVAAHEVQKSAAYMDVVLGAGTDIVSVPDGIPDVASDVWVNDFVDIYPKRIPASGRGRYLVWLKLVAAPEVSDLELLFTKVAARMGVTEAGVSGELAGFRRNER